MMTENFIFSVFVGGCWISLSSALSFVILEG